jgi:hypothetical protein
MSEFVSQNGEFLGRRHVRNKPNFASEGNSLGWGNGLVVFHRDSLFGNELLELVREFPGVTRGLRKLGQRLAFGLLDIEDESGTESGQPIVDGKSNKEIVSRLNLSANTVAVHRANIMDALGIHKTAELVVFAIRNGLVNVP